MGYRWLLPQEIQPKKQAEAALQRRTRHYTAKPADRQIRSIEYHRFSQVPSGDGD